MTAKFSRGGILPVIWGRHGRTGHYKIKSKKAWVLYLDETADSVKKVPGAAENPDAVFYHEQLHWTHGNLKEEQIRDRENQYRKQRGIRERELFQNIPAGH
jgi:hypothetical protein